MLNLLVHHVTSRLQKVKKRLHVVHINFNVVWDPIKFIPVSKSVKNLLSYFDCDINFYIIFYGF